jgi:hypothetical protein
MYLLNISLTAIFFILCVPTCVVVLFLLSLCVEALILWSVVWGIYILVPCEVFMGV